MWHGYWQLKTLLPIIGSPASKNSVKCNFLSILGEKHYGRPGLVHKNSADSTFLQWKVQDYLRISGLAVTL